MREEWEEEQRQKSLLPQDYIWSVLCFLGGRHSLGQARCNQYLHGLFGTLKPIYNFFIISKYLQVILVVSIITMLTTLVLRKKKILQPLERQLGTRARWPNDYWRTVGIVPAIVATPSPPCSTTCSSAL